MNRLRLIHLTVQPSMVVDDGDRLVPVSAEPFVVAASDLAGFAETFLAELAEQEKRLNSDGS